MWGQMSHYHNDNQSVIIMVIFWFENQIMVDQWGDKQTVDQWSGNIFPNGTCSISDITKEPI